MSTAQKLVLHLAAAMSGLTGVLLSAMKYLMRGEDPYSVVHHPWQPHVLAAHVLVVPLLVFALGMVTRDHILGRLREGINGRVRRSGIVAVALGAGMIFSGYVLQVLTGAGPRRLVGLGHAAAGAAFFLVYMAHLIVSRPLARARQGGTAARAAEGREAGARLDHAEWVGLESIPRAEARRPQAENDRRRP